jgi:hypothetical protein
MHPDTGTDFTKYSNSGLRVSEYRLSYLKISFPLPVPVLNYRYCIEKKLRIKKNICVYY